MRRGTQFVEISFFERDKKPHPNKKYISTTVHAVITAYQARVIDPIVKKMSFFQWLLTTVRFYFCTGCL